MTGWRGAPRRGETGPARPAARAVRVLLRAGLLLLLLLLGEAWLLVWLAHGSGGERVELASRLAGDAPRLLLASVASLAWCDRGARRPRHTGGDGAASCSPGRLGVAALVWLAVYGVASFHRAWTALEVVPFDADPLLESVLAGEAQAADLPTGAAGGTSLCVAPGAPDAPRDEAERLRGAALRAAGDALPLHGLAILGLWLLARPSRRRTGAGTGTDVPAGNDGVWRGRPGASARTGGRVREGRVALGAGLFAASLLVVGGGSILERSAWPGPAEGGAGGGRQLPFGAPTFVGPPTTSGEGGGEDGLERWLGSVGDGACAPGAERRIYALRASEATVQVTAQGDLWTNARILEPAQAPLRPAEVPRRHQAPVLRARPGECVVLALANALGEPLAPPRVEGLALFAGGAEAIPPGGWWAAALPIPRAASAEGAWPLQVLAGADRRAPSAADGLFGAVVVEAPGATWTSRPPGAPLPAEVWVEAPGSSGVHEVVLFFHSLPERRAHLRLPDGRPVPSLDTMAGPFVPGMQAISFTSWPDVDRSEVVTAAGFTGSAPSREDDVDPYANTPLGVPSSLLTARRGEPMRIHAVHAGAPSLHRPHVHPWEAAAGAGLRPALATRGPETPATAWLHPGGALSFEPPCGAGGCEAFTGTWWLHCEGMRHGLGGMRARWRIGGP